MTYQLQVSSTTRINLLKLPIAVLKVAPMSLLYISLADHKRMGVLADVLKDRPVLASSTHWQPGYEAYRANDGKFGYNFGTDSLRGGWH